MGVLNRDGKALIKIFWKRPDFYNLRVSEDGDRIRKDEYLSWQYKTIKYCININCWRQILNQINKFRKLY